MKFKLMAIMVAGALALGTFAARAQAVGTQPAPQNEYARTYVHTLDEVKRQYFNRENVTADKWRILDDAAAGITNQEQLESALGVLTELTHGEVRLLNRHESDLVRANIGGGRIGFGLDIETTSLVSANGALVGKVEEGSTAEAAGLREGDYIVSVDGRPVSSLSVRQVLARFERAPGAKTNVKVWRDGKTSELVIENDLDGSTGINLPVTQAAQLAFISYVYRGSTAEAAGLMKDDHIWSINGKSMVGADAKAVIAALAGNLDETVTLEIERAGEHVTLRIPRGITPDWSGYFEFSAQSSGGGKAGAMDPYVLRSNWAYLGVHSLDWHGGTGRQVFESIANDYESTLLALLDLRNSKGNDMDSAAIVASPFVPEGLVMRFALAGGDQLRYYVRGGQLVKQVTPAHGQVVEEVLRSDIKTSKARLAVLVNGATFGVSKAVAFNLRASGRALIVGSTTGADSILSGYVPVVTGGQTLMLTMPVAQMVRPDGAVLGAVEPDHTAYTGAKETALDIMAGTTTFFSERVMLMLVGLMAIVIVGSVVLLARRKDTEVEDEAAAEDDKPASKLERTLSALAVVLAIVAIPGVFLFGRIMTGPPVGGHSEVVVQFYTDGSPESERMGAGFYALRDEMSGGVRFEVIDVRQHPEYLESTPNHARFAVSQVPFVWVVKVTYDRNGKEVDRGGSGGGGTYGLLKKHLLEQIRWEASSVNNTLPVEVKRQLPAPK